MFFFFLQHFASSTLENDSVSPMAPIFMMENRTNGNDILVQVQVWML